MLWQVRLETGMDHKDWCSILAWGFEGAAGGMEGRLLSMFEVQFYLKMEKGTKWGNDC